MIMDFIPRLTKPATERKPLLHAFGANLNVYASEKIIYQHIFPLLPVNYLLEPLPYAVYKH